MSAQAGSEIPWPPDLLRVGDLSCIALGELLGLASTMRAEPTGWSDALAGHTVACFLDPPTTGMTVVTGAAAQRLGMMPVMLPRNELLVGGGEPLDDIARTFSTCASALVAHAIAHRTLERVAEAAHVPVINALSDQHRPCQALGDLVTLRERFGTLEGLVLAFVGMADDGIAHSLMEAAALSAMDIRVACPADALPMPMVRYGAEAFAEMHGGSVTVTDDPREACKGADVVYTAAWVPPGYEHERTSRVERMRGYQVHPGLMDLAKPRAVFMHCLPARRGEEVSAHVIDGRRSLVWEQAANRVVAAQAVIYALVTGATVIV